MNKKILIIGATGILGKAVTEQFINDKYEVSVFSTNIDKASKLFPAANIIEGNLKDELSVKNALRGQDYIYMNLVHCA